MSETYSSLCFYCGVRTDYPTIDHVIARAWGGPNVPWNKVKACRDCNNRKANHSYEYFTGEQELPAEVRTMCGHSTTREWILAHNNGGDYTWQRLLEYEAAHEDRLREKARLANHKEKKNRRKSKRSTPPWWVQGYDKTL